MTGRGCDAGRAVSAAISTAAGARSSSTRGCWSWSCHWLLQVASRSVRRGMLRQGGLKARGLSDAERRSLPVRLSMTTAFRSTAGREL